MQNYSTPVFIHAIGSAKGEKANIADLEPAIISENNTLTLSALGVEHYRRTHKSHEDLLREAVEQTLKSESCSPGKIDFVLLSSHTFTHYQTAVPVISDTLKKMGIHAPVELIYLSRCASGISAIHYGKSLIASGEASCILTILVDKVNDEYKGRTLNGGMSLFSDGASSFILSRQGYGFRVEYLNEYMDNEMVDVKPEANLVHYLQQFAQGLKKVAGNVLAQAGVKPDQVRYVVTGNYNLSIMMNYGRIAGFKSHQLYTEEVNENSHLYSSDIVLNLEAMRRKKQIAHGDRLLVLGTGSYHWGAMTVTYIEE